MRTKLKFEHKWLIALAVIVAFLVAFLVISTTSSPSYFVGEVNEAWVNPNGEITAIDVTIHRQNSPEATFNRHLADSEFDSNGFDEYILNRNTLLIREYDNVYTVVGIEDKEYESLKEANLE